MLLVIHISSALASVAYATYLFVRPSGRKFAVNYGLIAATIASGTWLVVATHAPVLSSCMTGLLYVGVVTTATVAARYKLAHQRLLN